MYWLYYAVAKLTPDEVGIPKVKADQNTIQSILNQVYVWAGIVAILVIVIAGVLYVLSQGEANKIKQAKDAILYAVAGLIVIAAAFTLTQFVLFSVK
jgi:hypothetical protein